MTSRLSWARTLISVGLIAALAACSSVDLAEQSGAPADAAAGGAAANGSASAGAGAAGGSGVAGVQLESAKTDTEAPVTLAKVLYFDFDSYALRDEYAGAISAHAKHLSEDRTRHLVLAGHTDELGSREYNLALGQQRAEAVRRALLLLGAADNQVEAISYGEEKPASLGGDETSRALNRRVEITYR